MIKIAPDRYKMAELVETMKANHVKDMSQNALLMSTFGFFGEYFTNQLTMNLATISETSNEVFATKAKYDRSILTHAVEANIKNIYAVPAYMDVKIYIRESSIATNITNGSNTLVLDKKTPIYIKDFEYHLDYNVIISRERSYNYTSEGYTYIAQYDKSEINQLSNIESPYLPPVLKMKLNGEDYIMMYCRIRQVEMTSRSHKIISDDYIENKTFEFDFDSQLAHFDIMVNKPDGSSVILTPIFEGTPIVDNKKNYCYYTHIRESSIRVKFISTYYNPELNSDINVRLYTTQGANGNIIYTKNIIANAESDIYNYSNLSLYIMPVTQSGYGSNMKTIEDLKREIPMKILARESLTSELDLQNYFNILNDENNRVEFAKHLHNQNITKYYSYLLVKDNEMNVIPTNTLDIKIPDSIMKSNNDCIKPGTIIECSIDSEHAIISTDEHDSVINYNGYDKFYYSIPFLIKVTRKPTLHTSYYLNILDIDYVANFSYINKESFLQFICTSINIKRNYMDNSNIYKISTSIVQNIDQDLQLVEIDNNGNITNSNKLKAFLLFYDIYGNPVKYKMCDIVDYDKESKEYFLEAALDTEDEFDQTGNYINITNLNDFKSDTVSDTYLPRQTKVALYVLYNDGHVGNIDDAGQFVSDLDGFVLSNKYTLDPGIEFFINYSEMMSSVVKVSKDEDEEMMFNLSSLPLLQYKYMNSEERMSDFITNIITRKLYIDNALNILEDGLGIDMKMFNTYGPSKTFTIGHDNIKLNRTNIKLRLRLKLDVLAQDNLKDIIITDIKTYIENINNITDLHFSNLDQYLRNKFPSIQWIEFLGINDYDTSKQYIRKDSSITNCVPEFLNINTINDYPDIEISIV